MMQANYTSDAENELKMRSVNRRLVSAFSSTFKWDRLNASHSFRVPSLANPNDASIIYLYLYDEGVYYTKYKKSPVYFCTGNNKKLQEMSVMLDRPVIGIKFLGEILECQGDEHTVFVNKFYSVIASLKKYAPTCTFINFKIPVITEDTVLKFNKWKNIGVYVKYYPNELIMKIMAGESNNKVEAVCGMVVGDLSDPIDPSYCTIEGKCSGTIINEERGSNGFHWDSIFIPDGHDRTFAEMEKDEKNRLSHRADAIKQLSALFELM
jgi:non-canonical purine NTP pyrophosphatase (RdgB/HAM1 family)